MDRIEQLREKIETIKQSMFSYGVDNIKYYQAQINANRQEAERLAMLLEVDCV